MVKWQNYYFKQKFYEWENNMTIDTISGTQKLKSIRNKLEKFDSFTIASRFIEISKTNPNAVALKYPDGKLTYGELNFISCEIATIFLKNIKDNNKIIAIHATRSPLYIASMLACARSGLAFALMDSAYPSAKLIQMVQIVNPAAVVGTDNSKDEIEKIYKSHTDAQIIALDNEWLNNLLKISRKKIENQDVNSKIEAESVSEIAYLLFTSGTTGKPKCIKTGHAPLNHFVNWYEKNFYLHPKMCFHCYPA